MTYYENHFIAFESLIDLPVVSRGARGAFCLLAGAASAPGGGSVGGAGRQHSIAQHRSQTRPEHGGDAGQAGDGENN